MTQNYLTESDINKYLANERIFFARIVELPDYKETEGDTEIAKVNSKYVLKNSLYGNLPVGEIINFLPREDGYTYGYAETKTKNKESFINQKDKNRQTKGIRIERMNISYYFKDKIDNCLVIFISIKTNKIIGYYKNATIYREMQKNSNYQYKNITFLDCNNGIFYNFKTKNENAILLKNRLKIEVKKDLHCGQSFIKYFDDKNKDYVKNILLPNLLIIK